MQRATGGWVIGDRFWDRERETALLIEYLRDGTNILLTGQRRIGKTSLVREVGRRLNGEFSCIYADLQNCGSGSDAITELAAATFPQPSTWKRVCAWASGIGGRVSDVSVHDFKIGLRAAVIDADWRPRGEQLLDVLTQSELPVTVVLDELPILVSRMLKGDDYTITAERRKQTDEFLSWLRHVSQKHQGTIRFVVTGSIGLEPIVRQAGLSATLNNLKTFDLGPWDRATAGGCIEALAAQYLVPLAQGAVDSMLDEIGLCIPHHVQVFFDNIYEACQLRNLQLVTTEVVKEIYAHKMLSSRGHTELSHLEERLKIVLGLQLQEIAIELLTEAAVVPGGLSHTAARILARDRLAPVEDPVLREILEILEYDGYLQLRGESYVFVSKLLKDWWKSRFQFLYQPAAKRSSA